MRDARMAALHQRVALFERLSRVVLRALAGRPLLLLLRHFVLLFHGRAPSVYVAAS